MDPITVLSIVSGSIALAAKCASVAQQLYDISAKFKQAELTIRAVGEECEIIRLAWTRIEKWVLGWADDAAADPELLHRLHRSIETGSMILSALEDNLLSIGGAPASNGIGWRSKIVWNENALAAHQQRIRGLVSSVHLLLDVVRLPSAVNRHELLEKKNSILRRSEESAWTIVQSRPSTVISSIHRRLSVESAEYFYNEFSFDDQLFTARVYKRNYGSIGLKQNYNNLKVNPQDNESLTSQHEQVRAMDETKSLQGRPMSSALSIEQDEIHHNDQDLSDVQTEHTDLSRDMSTNQNSHEDSRYPQDSDSLHTIRMIENHEDDPNLIIQPLGESTDHSVIPPIDTWHLDLAAAQGRYDVLKTLLQRHSTDIFREWRTNTFFDACKRGNAVMARFLVHNERNLPAHDSSQLMETSTVPVAALDDNFGVAKYLLATADECGMQPIHYAAWKGHLEIVELLLDAGASAFVRDSIDNQPIHYAVLSQSTNIVDALLAKGACIDDIGANGNSPVHVAISRLQEYKDIQEIIRHLVCRGASLELTNQDGYTPLQIACDDRKERWLGALLLLDLGSELTAGASWDTSPFGLATLHRHLVIMQMLLRRTRHDFLDSGDGAPALRALARGRRIGGTRAAYSLNDLLALEVLLLYKVKVRAKGPRGNEALHILACSSPKLSHTIYSRACAKSMVKLLLNNGADADAENDNGETPLHFATKRKKGWLVTMLQQHIPQKVSMAKIDRLNLTLRYNCDPYSALKQSE
ncbi:hypothetical protein MMC11_001251 [Xylographa trunciseda]|nr:hypothetical protein [Xylographa trunciseda]